MSKPMNHKRRLRQAEKAMRAGETPATRDPAALALALRGGSGAGRHPDRRKERSRKACRGKVAW